MRPLLLLFPLLLVSCSAPHPSVPATDHQVDTLPRLYPDYSDVTIPSNLAPVNFMVDEETVSEVVAHIAYPGGSQTYGIGTKVIIDADEWHQMLEAARGDSMMVTLYTKRANTQGANPQGSNTQGAKVEWTRHPAFALHVADADIDPYVSYRLIEPSYVAYENIDIMQRDLTSFEESTILSNRHEQQKGEGRCINCHSYHNYRTNDMLLHLRGEGGGTLLVRNGKSRLMTDLKREGMISNPVYPAWHPTLPLIAFSTNHTGQFFHTHDVAKVEVIDRHSELVLYDVDADQMTRIPSPDEELENFPTWSPDGTRLYYCSAFYQQRDTTIPLDRDQANHFTELRYNLYSRDFNLKDHIFSDRSLVLDLDSMGQSATLPRVSPDGRYLLFASGRYGCFHIWHADADIRLLDLESGRLDSLSLANSSRADSYPTWSSNGRWILMASRREDGNYSRIYISYFDQQGKAHKAFAMPQQDPEHDRHLLRSYNRPEPMIENFIFNNTL